MASVLLGIDDPGSGRELGAALSAAGHTVTWVGALETTPTPGQETPQIIIVDGESPGMELGLLTASWRGHEPPPILVVLSGTPSSRAEAERVRAHILAKPVTPPDIVAETHRLLAPTPEHALDPRAALAALGLSGGGLPEDEAAAIVTGARSVAIAHVREALRPHMFDYASATALAERLYQRRVLTPSEARLAMKLDGGSTIRSAIDGAGRTTESIPEAIPAYGAARLLWGLVSGGAVTVAPEPPPDHPTAWLRGHLRARVARLANANHYAVLELTLDALQLDIDRATGLLELRFGPEALSQHDLGDLTAAGDANWEQIAQARQVLGDPRLRVLYDSQLCGTQAELEETRLRQRMFADEAERAFVRGQHALAAGNVFRAVSELAAAARRIPDHPDYEVYAAWTRFLADDQRGLKGPERVALAQRQRAVGERALLGRRPWPRSLYVIGLLCEAGGDLDSAVAYFSEALSADEKLVVARQALARLGVAL